MAHHAFDDRDDVLDRGVDRHIAVHAGRRACEDLAFDFAHAHCDDPKPAQRAPQRIDHGRDSELHRIEQRDVGGRRAKQPHRVVQNARSDHLHIRAALELKSQSLAMQPHIA